MDKDKLIKNEQIIRDQNIVGSRALKKFFHYRNDFMNKPIKFMCECSDLSCKEPVIATIKEYEKLHKRKDYFMIVKGHKTPQIDKTIEIKDGFELVEKPDLASWAPFLC